MLLKKDTSKNQGEEAIDFKEDKDKAEKWANEKYEKWKNGLKQEEKKALEVLKKPNDTPDNYYDINAALKFFGGDVDRRPMDEEAKPKTERYKNDIKNIEKTLNYEEAKLDQSLYVYKDMSLEGLAMIDEKLFKNSNGTIIQEKFKELKYYFTEGKSSEFTIVDLTEGQPTQDTGLMRWHIKLPKGTPSGYFNENQLVLSRDIGIEITDCKIIIQKGKEFIRVEAQLVSREEVDKKIEKTATNFNNDFNQALSLPKETKMIDFQLSNEASSLIFSQVRELFRDVGSQIHNNIIQKVTQFMLEKNGEIIISDRSPATIKEAFEPKPQTEEILKDLITAGGVYNFENRTIVLDATNSFKQGVKLDSGDFVHEIGHAIDYYVGELVHPGKNATMSDSLGFKNIFEEEKNNLTEYGKNNAHEFWAEAFRLMHSKNPNDVIFVKEHAPKTYEFINEVLNNIK